MSRRARRASGNAPPRQPASPARSGFWARLRATVLLGAASAVFLWAAYPPLDWGLLGWTALTPLVVAARLDTRPAALYLGVWVSGLGFFLAAVHWVCYADPTAWLGWLALGVYLSAYWPAFVWAVRQCLIRRGLPAVLAVPPIWTALELARSHLLTGFPWYLLGHTQHRLLPIIQIADLAGVYAVSFLLAAVNALLADLWGLKVRPAGLKRWAWSAGVVLGLVAGTLVYGAVRMHQVAGRWVAGPRVAVIQGNEPQRVKDDPDQWKHILLRHMKLTVRAARDRPALIVWPETMFTRPWVRIAPDVTDADLQALAPGLTRQRLQEVHQANLSDLRLLREAVDQAAAGADVRLLIGLNAIDYGRQGRRKYNSALYLSERNEVLGRYDKIHLVPFGEYLPLGNIFPWLNALTPYPEGYSLDSGVEATRFDLAGCRFGVIICFEDTVPPVVRRFVYPDPAGRKGADFLLNISNDGWFAGSSELDVHLAISVFRAVEHRVTVFRSVNTGISGAVWPTGEVQRLTDAAGRSKLTTGHLAAAARIDPSVTLYTRWGDWWAWLNGLAALVGVGWGLAAGCISGRQASSAVVPRA